MLIIDKRRLMESPGKPDGRQTLVSLQRFSHRGHYLATTATCRWTQWISHFNILFKSSAFQTNTTTLTKATDLAFAFSFDNAVTLPLVRYLLLSRFLALVLNRWVHLGQLFLHLRALGALGAV